MSKVLAVLLEEALPACNAVLIYFPKEVSRGLGVIGVLDFEEVCQTMVGDVHARREDAAKEASILGDAEKGHF